MNIKSNVEIQEEKKSKTKKYYWSTKLRMGLTLLVIVGALNWGTTAIGYNLVELVSNYINKLFRTNYPLDKIVYMIVGISGVLLAMRRSTWLPFLGKTVFPDSLVPLKSNPNSDMKIKIKTKPNAKIAYWAALPTGANPDVITAYGDYSNGGVIMSDDKGNAELPVLAGSSYTVPSGRKISRHVHYRVLAKPYGMMGKIKTVFY